MNFSTDRDLLLYEPTLFNDLPWVSQQRLNVTDGKIVGTILSSASAGFEEAEIGQGSVLLVNNEPVEVIERMDQATLIVSLPRMRTTSGAIPPGDVQSAAVIARTFAPQASLVRGSLLRLLGLETADAVVSLSLMSRLESLGTIERVFGSAAALTGDSDALIFKSAEYRRRFREAASRSPVQIDTTGDGLPDEKRYVGSARLVDR